MNEYVVPAAHLGGRRRKPWPTSGTVRVELQLPVSIASRLFAFADERGQTISRVGDDALKEYLLKGDRRDMIC